MTFSTYCAHTEPIFKDLNVLTINKLVIHRIGIVIYKFNNGLLPTALNSLYKKNNEIHQYDTRTKKYVPHFCRNSIFLFCKCKNLECTNVTH